MGLTVLSGDAELNCIHLSLQNDKLMRQLHKKLGKSHKSKRFMETWSMKII